jgi:hypothetical protein
MYQQGHACWPALHGLDEVLTLHAQQTPSTIVIVFLLEKLCIFFFRFAKVGLAGWETGDWHVCGVVWRCLDCRACVRACVRDICIFFASHLTYVV